jgi:4-methylaminobutanoate oxidase (formaldehyde-forming)
MGPDSRALLQSMTRTDLSNEAFGFASSQEIELAHAIVRASRITYVGELGWELYIPTEFAAHVFDALLEAGKAFNLRPIGMHAMNSLRIEKAYRHWGHDISEEDTPVEAGLSFAVDMSKPAFIGRDAIAQQKAQQKAQGLKQRLVQFLLTDPDAMLHHNEPIYRDNEIVGYIASGMYGHTLGAAVGLGYVRRPGQNAISGKDGGEPNGADAEFIRSGHYEIEVAGKRIEAKASLRPLYDPTSKRVRG